MGKLKAGIHGPVSGKIGNTVSYSIGDTHIIRIKRQRTKTYTEAQLANQVKMGKKQNWLTPLKDLLDLGFRNEDPFTKGMAKAMGYLSRNAVEGTGENTQVLSEKMLISQGELPGATNVSAILDGQEVVFSWNPEILRKASAYDQALVLAYNTEKKVAHFEIRRFFRRDGEARVSVSVPGEYHCYLGFAAEDRLLQSDSHYLGVVNV